MLMREINLKNKEFKTKLDKLIVEVKNVINDKELCNRALNYDLERQNPELRIKNGYTKDVAYKHSPHWDVLPENCINILDKMDPCGMDYLNYQKKCMAEGKDPDASSGFPNKEIFFSVRTLNSIEGADHFKKLNESISDISYRFLGGHSVALSAFYPPGGYIPWHHNGNAPGFNILLHYSFGGNGSFYTWDKDRIVEYKDVANDWVCRAGRFLDTVGQNVVRPRGQGQETPHVGVNDASWHSAKTFDWRFTLSTITNQEDMWLDIIDELETE